ncbi:MAG: L-threonylcarbamoyladenylate synthase, partial [Pseudomonadota bacterium]
DAAGAESLAEFSDLAYELAAAFWPGPLTLVLPLRKDAGVADLVTAGQDTVAIRVPAHETARALLHAFDGPLAAPSANPSGRISPTTAAHVAQGLGNRINGILDAGACELGLESTILAVRGSQARLLREGGAPREALEPLTGPLTLSATPGAVEAPGQLASHYAPRTPLVMNSDLPDPQAVRIGFGPGAADLSLSEAGDLREAAARLFAVLHEADALARASGRSWITVAAIPDTGLGRAINDRLRRASAP